VGSQRIIDLMVWDVLGGQAAFPMTNVRNLKLPQWRTLAADPAQRSPIPLTEFCEFTPDKHDLATASQRLRGRCGSTCRISPMFAVAGFACLAATERAPGRWNGRPNRQG
jgi:putative SOS response-associated peptidase YedK